MNKISAIITEIKPVLPAFTRRGARGTAGSYVMWLDCLDLALQSTPGQFVMVYCGPECTLARPLSIHAVSGGKVALYFNVFEDGKGTTWLARRKIDDRIQMLGPLGNGFEINPDSFSLLLVAGGIGIAPLRFLAQEALRGGRTVSLLMGASTASQLYPNDLLPTGITYMDIATEDGSTGKKGMVTRLLPDFIESVDEIFACGPMPMFLDMATKYGKLLENKQVQVSLEVRMGCGLGFCYACTVRTKGGVKQVCKDGPVFNLKDILWDKAT